ncbi:hypothetical protein Tco_0631863, partial [Tanacetum coccineum]
HRSGLFSGLTSSCTGGDGVLVMSTTVVWWLGGGNEMYCTWVRRRCFRRAAAESDEQLSIFQRASADFNEISIFRRATTDSGELVTIDLKQQLAQRRLEDKQPEEKTSTDCLVKEREKVHLGIKVGANITVTGVPGQEGAEGNIAEKKKKSMKANLRKLLKYRAWLTRRSPVRRFSSLDEDVEISIM